MKLEFSIKEVLSQLADEGLIKPIGEADKIEFTPNETQKSTLPWYVKLFVGISAWIAAILITAFFFIIGIIDENQALFFGLVFCALAIVLNYVNRTNTFLSQLSLAMSLTGQILAIIGLFFSFDYELVYVVIPIIILELFLIWLHRDSVLRFISTLVITIFILVLIFDWHTLDWLHVFIFVLAACMLFIYLKENDLKLFGFEELISPVGGGMTVSLLGILIMPLLEDYYLRWEITAIALFALLLFLITRIVVDLGYSLRNPIVIGLAVGCLLLLIPAIRMPGILVALIVLLLGFWRNSRGFIGLASVFLVFYIWAYYYSLEWTLLIKSLVLMGSGVILLALRYFIVRTISKAGGEI